MRKLLILSCFSLCLITLSGCMYRMPGEDELTTVPSTNHPDLTRQPAGDWQPSVSY